MPFLKNLGHHTTRTHLLKYTCLKLYHIYTRKNVNAFIYLINYFDVFHTKILLYIILIYLFFSIQQVFYACLKNLLHIKCPTSIRVSKYLTCIDQCTLIKLSVIAS